MYHENQIYDGYRLTFSGYDFLALHSMVGRGSVAGVGTQVGVGKESDIFVCEQAPTEEGKEGKKVILKLHRLGRVSFRGVKNQRDYLQHRHTNSWLYMSRLSAQVEYRYMQMLHEAGYPVPRPVDANRHAVIMSLVPGRNLSQLREVKDAGAMYQRLMDLIMRFASDGLIHCDFNEFNIMVTEDKELPVVIDFPQMVSTSHENAKELFERDVDCIETFFARRFDFVCDSPKPRWEDVVPSGLQLDLKVKASGADLSLLEGMEEEQPQEEEEQQKSKKPELTLEQKIRNDVRKQRNKKKNSKRNARTKRETKREVHREADRELKREVKDTL